MKVNITWGKGEHIHGYANIVPKQPEELENLDMYYDGGELEELVIIDGIDYVPHKKRKQVLMGWISKLKRGGIITIGGNNILEIVKATSFYRKNIDTINNDLFGEDGQKKSCSTPFEIIDVMEEAGCEVIKKRLNRNHYSIEGQRQ